MRYLLSGGVSMRTLIPRWSFGLARTIERLLDRRARTWPMFALIVVRRADRK